jgi:hypothetical protein
MATARGRLRPLSTDSLSRLDGGELLLMAGIYRQISRIDSLVGDHPPNQSARIYGFARTRLGICDFARVFDAKLALSQVKLKPQSS